MSIKCLGQASDGRWTYQFYERVNGEQKRKRLRCPRSVHKDLYRKWAKELYTGDAIGRRKLFETLDEYLPWASSQKSTDMIAQEKRNIQHMKDFFRDVDLSSIKRHRVLDFRAWRLSAGKSIAKATVNRTLCTTSYFFNWCVERDYLRSNPAHKVLFRVDNRRTVKFTSEVVRDFVEKADDYQKRWVMLALFTGMRRSEFLSLRWKDVDFDSNRITLEAKNTKSKYSRSMGMPNLLREYLWSLRLQEPFFEYVVSFKGQRVSDIKRSWKTLRDSIPFALENEYTLHHLRHINISMRLMAGVPPIVVMREVGHRDLRTTMRYAHVDDETAASYANRVSDYLYQRKAG